MDVTWSKREAAHTKAKNTTTPRSPTNLYSIFLPSPFTLSLSLSWSEKDPSAISSVSTAGREGGERKEEKRSLRYLPSTTDLLQLRFTAA